MNNKVLISQKAECQCVVGKSPCGQVDLLLRARLLTLRQKVLNMDTDFLLDLIKLMNKREGGKHVPYERVCPCKVQDELQS
jgi:hypothetical protein